MDDHIIKAAREAGWTDIQLSMAAPAEMERLSRFYAIAFKAGMERAAEICDERFSRHYGNVYLVSHAIRAEAHAQNQPKPLHDSSVM